MITVDDNLIAKLEKLIDKMPQKGNKPEDCQKICVLHSLIDFKNCVNGVTERDFYHEEEEE